MSQELKIPVSGLYLDANSLVLPDGALRRAENVVLRRPGLIEPRRGFNKLPSFPFAAADTARQLFSFDSKLYAVRTDASAPYTPMSVFDGTSTWTAVTMPDRLLQDVGYPYKQRTQVARKNLYICQGVNGSTAVYGYPPDTGIFKLTSAAVLTASKTYLNVPCILVLSALVATGTAIASSTTVAYRTVIRKTDANGLVIRSHPSSRYYVSNTTGGTVDVSLNAYVTGGFQAGDVLEVYRSAAVTGVTSVIPGDEMQLVLEHVLTAGEFTAGTFQVTDHTTQGGRGAALYTNSTQEGIGQANLSPPGCEDVALFADCMFFAQAVKRSSGLISITDVSQFSGFNYHNNAGAGFAGTTALANPTITAIASTADFDVGQLVLQGAVAPGSGGANIPGDARIISKTATTITLDKNCTAAGAVTFSACDVIHFETTDFFAWNSNITFGSFPSFNAVLFGAGAIQPRAMGENIAQVVTRYFTSISGADRISPSVLVLSDSTTQVILGYFGNGFTHSLAVGQANLVAKSHLNAVSPQPTQSLLPVERPNVLMYSKPDEPEHVPELNTFVIGSERNVIRRIIALRDGLLIWTDEGLFRLTGVFPDFRIDAIDRTIMLAGFNTPAAIDDYCYAFTEGGVVRASISGVENLSEPIWSALKRTAFALTAYSSSVLDAWAFLNHNENEYYLKLPPLPLGSPSEVQPFMWIYNAASNAWSTWIVAPSAGVTHSDQFIYLAMPDGVDNNIVRKERHATTGYLSTDDYRGDIADDSIVFTGGTVVTAINTTTLVVTFNNAFTVNIGDCIVLGGVAYKVTAANGGGTTATLNTVSGITGGMALTVGFTAFASTAEWYAFDAGNPGELKQWREIGPIWDKRDQVERFTCSLWNDFEALATDVRTITQTAVSGDDATPSTNQQIARVLVGRQSSRGRILRMAMSVAQAYTDWSVSGVSIVYEPMDTRTRRVNTFRT